MSTVIAPGCAFGFWHMWGVLKARGIRSSENVCCISGSSLAMVVYLCGLDIEQQLEKCSRLRETMNVCNLFSVVRRWLECELPDDCHTRCNGNMTILLRHIVRWSVHSFSFWYSKADLINCLIAACVVVPSRFRNSWFMDCIDHKPAGDYTRLPRRLVFYIPSKEKAHKLYLDGNKDGKIPFIGRK